MFFFLCCICPFIVCVLFRPISPLLQAVVLGSLSLLGVLAADLGAAGIKAQSRHVTEVVVGLLGNNDKAIKAAAIAAFGAITERTGVVCTDIPPSLATFFS